MTLPAQSATAIQTTMLTVDRNATMMTNRSNNSTVDNDMMKEGVAADATLSPANSVAMMEEDLIGGAPMIAIIGGVAGCVCLSLLVGGLLFWRSRKASSRAQQAPDSVSHRSDYNSQMLGASVDYGRVDSAAGFGTMTSGVSSAGSDSTNYEQVPKLTGASSLASGKCLNLIYYNL